MKRDIHIVTLLRKMKQKRLLRRVIAFLSVIVLLVTVNTLKFEADTLEHVATCGMEEHSHEEACFDENGALSCALTEHVHTDACFQNRPVKAAETDIEQPVEEMQTFELDDDADDELNARAFSAEAVMLDDGIEASADELDTFELSESEAIAPDFAAKRQGYTVGSQYPFLLSDVIAEQGLNISIDDVTRIEQLFENDEPDLFRYELMDGDIALYPTADFELARLLIYTDNDVELVELLFGIAPTVEPVPDDEIEQSIYVEIEEKAMPIEPDEESEPLEESETVEKTETVEIEAQTETEEETETVKEIEEEAEEITEEETETIEIEEKTETVEETETEEVTETVEETEEENDAEQPEENDGEAMDEPLSEEIAADVAPAMRQVEATISHYAASIDLSSVDTFPVALDALMAQAERVMIAEAAQSVDATIEPVDVNMESIGETIEPAVDEIEASIEETTVTLEDVVETQADGEVSETLEPLESEAIEPMLGEITIELGSDEAPGIPSDNAATTDDWALDYDAALLSIERTDEGYMLSVTGSFEQTVVTVNNGELYVLTLLNGAVRSEYPAATFSAATEHVVVNVEAPEGAFPAGTTMVVTDVEDEDTISSIAGKVEEGFVRVERVHAVDITFLNADGVEIEPLIPISVTMSVREIEAEKETVVVHVDHDGEAQIVAETTQVVSEAVGEELTAEADTALAFVADAFSVYAVVVGEKLETMAIAADGNTYRIEVTFAENASLPAGAALAVSEVTDDNYLAQVQQSMAGEKRITMARFFDIRIMNGDEEIQPDAPVMVKVALDSDAEKEADAVPCAVHFTGDEISIVKATEADEAVSFRAESFSVWGVVYTVDFHNEADGEAYTYTLTGGGAVRLSDIVTALHLAETNIEAPVEEVNELTGAEPAEEPAEKQLARFMDAVASVTFSDPGLVWVGQAEADTTVGELKAQYELKPQYSLDMSLEDVREGDALTIAAGDWALISLRPFESTEALTVTLMNGDSFTIAVTDAQVNVTSLASLRGKKFALVSHDYYGNPGALLLPEWKANGYLKGQWVDVNAMDGSTPQWQFTDAGNNKFYITDPNGKYLHVWIGNGQHHVWLSDERQALNVGLYQGGYIRITNDSGAAVNLWGWDANQGFTAYDGYTSSNTQWNELFRVYDLTGQHIDNSGHYAIYIEKNGYYYVLKNDLSTVRIDASESALKALSRDYLWQFEDSDAANCSYVARTIKDGRVYQLQFNNGWRLVPEEEHAYNDDTLHVWVGDSGNTSIWGPDTSERLFFNSSNAFEDNSQGNKSFVRLFNVDRRLFTVKSADYSMGGVTGWDMDQNNQTGVSSFVTRTNLGNNGVYTNNWAIEAVPNTGFSFDHWELDGVALDANTYPVSLQSGKLAIPREDSVLRAVFRKNGSGSSNPYPPRPVPDEPEWILDALEADPIAGTDKTAEVYDYENRIYRIDLTGNSGFQAINSDLALAFVTDVSNSMLFPDSLEEVRKDGNPVTLWYQKNTSSPLGSQIRSKGLDTSKVYITIGDKNTTSTQYAVFYVPNKKWVYVNGNWTQGDTYNDHDFAEGWYALDASYYARWMAGVFSYDDAKMSSGGSHRCKKLDETYSLHSSDPNYSGGYTYTLYEPSEYWEHSFRSEAALYARNEDSTFSNRLWYLSESVKQALEQIYRMANYYPLGSIYAALETFAGSTKNPNPNSDTYWQDYQSLLNSTLGEESTWGTRHQKFVQIGGATAYNGANFADNEAAIINKLKNLTTQDGTAQDVAIQELNRVIPWSDIPSSTNLKKYVIMITDGAPNRSGLTPGAVATLINNEKENGTLKDTTLITVGLGIEDVPGGQQLLHTIADSDAGGKLYYSATEGYDLLKILMEIIHDIMQEAAVVGNVVDTIDPVFYPVNRDTGLPLTLTNGKAYIALDGTVLSSRPTNGTPYGEVTYDQTADTWKVTWTNQEFKPKKNGGWHGTVYVKSKEEFMGGNTINTNVGQATITPTAYYRIDDDGNRAQGAQNIAIPAPTTYYPNDRRLPVKLDTPYVNVDELSFTKNDTEWTVYLDTTVAPKEQLKALYGKIMVNEVVDHTLEQQYRLNGGNTTYTLREGTADNTTPVNGQEQFPLTRIPGMGIDNLNWDTLYNTGKIENIPYTAYGHTAGSFTVELIPVYKEGENKLADETGDGHVANIVGDEVEKYTIRVTYKPRDYDATKNYHTGTYGTKKAGKLTDDIVSENNHIINVYAKPIEVYKVDADDPTIKVEGAKFGLYRAARQSEIDDEKAVSLAQYNAELTGQYFLVDEVSSSAEGVVSLAVPVDGMDDQKLLVPGIEYYLIETEAPTGYQRDDSIKKITVTAGPNRYTSLSKQIIEEADLANNRPYDWEQGVKIFVDGVLARIVDPTTRTDEEGRNFIWKNDTVVFQADYTNQRVQELALKKVGVNNSDPNKTQYELGGAKFTIYQATGTNYDTKGDVVTLQGVALENLTSDETTGIFWQGDMPIGHYLLEEVETPPGYNSLSGLVHLSVDRDDVTASYTVVVGNIANIATVTEAPENVFTIAIVNTAGVRLPATGGSGTAIFTAAGLAMIVLAAFLLLRRKAEY